MTQRERFTIGELVARTGVPAATIHHYRRKHLFPPPERAAPNRFLYDERHVHALRLIRMLRERRGLPLDTIRRLLPKLSGLEAEEAFRSEMWEPIVSAHLDRSSRRLPEARLLSAGVDAFSRRGYGEVNVDDLCHAAGVAKGSFYRHFRSKEELFLACVEAASEDVVQSFSRSVEHGPLPETAAVAALARALAPRAPMYLDLLQRTLQRRPEYAPAAQRIIRDLASAVGERWGGAPDARRAGADLLGRAAVAIMEETLGGDAGSSPAGRGPLSMAP